MNHYLTLLKLRDIASRSNLICKGKKYLKSGQQPPKGVKLHKGPKGGTYYMTEDVHAANGTEPKKRLPAFRKQEDGSVMHRTKAGEHGPGAYRIELKDGEHHLTFEGKDGDVKSLGKHGDIKELKRMVAGFKGGEKKEAPIEPKQKDAALESEPVEPRSVKDQKATVRRRKEAETQQPGFTAKLGRGYTIGWSGNQFQRVEVTDPDTNETSVYDIKMREGTRGKQLFTKTEAKAEAIRLATERKEKGSDAIIQGISDKMHEQKTKPSAPLAQQAIDKHIASNKEKNIDRLVFARSGDSYLTSTGETVPANKLEQNVNRLSIEHGKYVDVLEQVNKQGDLGHTRTISTPGAEDKPFSSGDKRHDPDQKKIATGLGETTKKKAKESVAEFGVDTRQKIKEIAEKKTRQDRLSQNRLDTKNW